VSVRVRILNFIDGYWGENWTSPTVEEIAAHVGRSKSNTHRYLLDMTRERLLVGKQLSPSRVLYRVRR
jgi:DNA-binding IclR family transcriptional regulator